MPDEEPTSALARLRVYPNWQRDNVESVVSASSNLAARTLPTQPSIALVRRTPTVVVDLPGKQAGSLQGQRFDSVVLRKLEGTVHGAQPALNPGGWDIPGRSIRLPSATEGDSSVELGPASKTGGPHGQQFDPASFRRSSYAPQTGAFIMAHKHKLILIRR